ncbi:hypothetical protein HII36_19700 [Nonomuraea sp. NN258]|uniref:hypothetical protein n=1 Tax=Nonomuraea antri TaxID=2730852 RepID=UPI0015684074|nr:hypothetical protein [Nonomuraea antri]NRQ34060.1 hypothetical protein [Nonomuraea antri]
MSLRRRIATLSSIAALGLSVVALNSGPAMAAPSGCTTQQGSNWASSLCTSGTGRHMVVVRARHYTGPILVTGPCVAIGQTSWTTVNWPITYVGWAGC